MAGARGTFMAILDVALVNVAIPSMRSNLHASIGAVELVIFGYTITYASLLVSGGRLGDIYGRRRLFIIGLIGFAAASALCGAAPNTAVLIAARGVQGIGGALLYPQVLAIIQVTFTGWQRGKALGIFGSVVGGQLVHFLRQIGERLYPKVGRGPHPPHLNASQA